MPTVLVVDNYKKTDNKKCLLRCTNSRLWTSQAKPKVNGWLAFRGASTLYKLHCAFCRNKVQGRQLTRGHCKMISFRVSFVVFF